MAPWVDKLEKDRQKSKTDVLDAAMFSAGMTRSKPEDREAQKWIDDMEELPGVFLIAGSGRKVLMVHHPIGIGGSLVGVAGFRQAYGQKARPCWS